MHTALGYASWREYAVAELGYSESHAYRLLDHGRVLRALLAEGVSPAGETVTERQARELAPVLRREGPQAMATVWHARFTKRLEQATRELHSLAEDIKAATGLDREARELLREDVGSVGDAMDDVFRAASGDQR